MSALFPTQQSDSYKSRDLCVHVHPATGAADVLFAVLLFVAVRTVAVFSPVDCLPS